MTFFTENAELIGLFAALVVLTWNLWGERKQTERLVEILTAFVNERTPEQKTLIADSYANLSPMRKRVIQLMLSSAELGASLTPSEDDDMAIEQLKAILYKSHDKPVMTTDDGKAEVTGNAL